MEVARTSMIHAATPHFLWSFAGRYAVHQLNLWPHVSLPKTSPTLRWTGKVGDASVFRVWGSCAFVRDTSADKLSSRAIPCGPAPSGVSQVDPLPLVELVEVTVDSGASGGGASRGAASGGAEPAGAEPGGGEPASAEAGGAEPEGAEPGGAKIEGAERGGAESEGAESGGAEPRGTAFAGGPAETRGPAAGGTGDGGGRSAILGGAGVTAGAGGTGGAGAAGPGGTHTRGTGVARAGGVGGAGVGDPGDGGIGARGAGAGGSGAGDPGAGGTGAGGARVGGAGGGGTGAGGAGAGGAGVGGAGAGGTGAGGAGAGDPGAGGAGARAVGVGGTGAGGIMQRRPFFVPPQPSSLSPRGSVLRQVLSLASSTGLNPLLLCPPPHQSQPQLHPGSPLPAPSPYTEQTDSLIERREPESHLALPVSAVRTGRRVPRPRPPPVPSTHIMALRPSSVPLRFDLARVASPTVTRLLATVVTEPSFESAAASALVAERVDFAAACRLDYAASLVSESESDCPPSVGGECALGTDVLEDNQEDFECLAPEEDPDAPDIPTPHSYAQAFTGPYSS
ncbi:unnamed protein product [Closterium sp. NIES-54]